ncbi:cytidine deaminase [Coraliomargarita parva]|uniref:cytidine deaminase n=1 Tax=Coraliomargarita parva TaxID=3014050 RepID=UPI0022B56260|nr:cytidine deaminase [Coraliomargarita parva]
MLPVPQIDLAPMLEHASPELKAAVLAQVENGAFSGCLKDLPGDPASLGATLLPLAKSFAVCPISGFRVGAVAQGTSGRLYLGANMEFTGASLGNSLHAEQSAVLNAWIHGETLISRLSVSEVPCGHCRQFLCELGNAGQLVISYKDRQVPLPELLPDAFNALQPEPHDLLNPPPASLQSIHPIQSNICQRALNAAQRSYTPYTHAAEGFIIEGDNGQVFVGRAAESAAFNPSVPAVICALNQRNLSHGRSYSIHACAHARIVTALNGGFELAESLLGKITTAPVERVLMESA